jgi:hypothetical protein
MRQISRRFIPANHSFNSEVKALARSNAVKTVTGHFVPCFYYKTKTDQIKRRLGA